MKKILCSSILCLFIFTTKAQITLDSSLSHSVTMIKLQKSGYKYVYLDYSVDLMYLYNLDFSLFKQISFPATLTGSYTIEYITEALFDTDSNTVEYALLYFNNNPYTCSFKVLSESGAVLLDVPGGRFPGLGLPAALDDQTFPPITNTPQGAKMRVTVYSLTGAFIRFDIYTLPGYLQCSICYSPELPQHADGNRNNGNIYISQSYPNPAFQFTQIDYVLPEKENEGVITFYDTNGREVKRYNVNNQSSHLNIPTAELSAGIYYYSLVTKSGMKADKKMIVIH